MNDTYDLIISIASKKYRVPFAWIKAVIATESNFDRMAFRAEPRINDASRGLMQLLLKTARSLGFADDPDYLFDPDVNIDLGTKLLAELLGRCGNDFAKVYSAYNSGSCEAYLTSAQVARNVERAQGNLATIQGEKKTPQTRKKRGT